MAPVQDGEDSFATSLVQVSLCVAVEDEKDCCWRGWGLPGPVSDMCYMASDSDRQSSLVYYGHID